MERNTIVPEKWPDRDCVFRILAKLGTGIEVGVQRGISAKYILDHGSSTITLVDPWWMLTDTPKRHEIYDNMLKRLRNHRNAGRVRIIIGFANEVVDQLHKVDFVHWDAGVVQNLVLEGFVKYWDFLKPRGLFLARGFTPTNPLNYVCEAIDGVEKKYGDVEIVGVTGDKDFSRSILLRRTA